MKVHEEPEGRSRWARLADWLDQDAVRTLAVGLLVFSWAAGMGYVAGYRAGRDDR